MLERVDARDVLDANATTKRAFQSEIVGRFQRVGPNTWDDYQLLPVEPEPLELGPGLQVQLERSGAELRVRLRGTVHRVRWVPSEDDQRALDDGADARAYFGANYLNTYADAPGIGAAAFIVKTLR
jgi:hypothetical protein